ncbi:MAG: hypothetical protein HY904_20730 [Deltaproteobacteria bacterium]|nr:hypothetical protein [Deltaproteobacteria bacterium]
MSSGEPDGQLTCTRTVWLMAPDDAGAAEEEGTPGPDEANDAGVENADEVAPKDEDGAKAEVGAVEDVEETTPDVDADELTTEVGGAALEEDADALELEPPELDDPLLLESPTTHASRPSATLQR